MAVLIVRNIDDGIVQALKERAARHSRSAEAEHRLILSGALLGPRKRSFSQVLASMPNVGEDEDFERNNDGRDATALIHDLIIVTRNVGDFGECGVQLFNPFQ